MIMITRTKYIVRIKRIIKIKNEIYPHNLRGYPHSQG